MIQLLNFLQPIPPLHNSTSIYFNPPSYSLHKPKSLTYKGSLEKRNSTCNCSKAEANVCIAEAEHATPHVQTLSKFPKEVLFGKVIMVQCDTTLLLREAQDSSTPSSLLTIKYLNRAGAKVLIASHWGRLRDEVQIVSREILAGWSPIDLGPNSIDELTSLLSKCKKVFWIGPVKFKLSRPDSYETFKLARLLETFSRGGCDVTVVGSASCKAISTGSSSFLSHCCLIESASVTWEFLKGRTLPGLAALDRAYPFEINWNDIYYNAAQPLVVDIGSGNGLFLLGMARGEKALNFLGLETNKKLVKRCLDSVHLSGNKNGYFIATNATSTFRSIVSSYPGKLVLVSIQCPNPDFNKPDHRWRMLQKSLVEAIVDMLTIGGKVFLQSDVEAVAISMRDQFMLYGKGRLVITGNDGDFETDNGRWLKENPYGVRSDWELHVLGRGAPMYRLMISKVDQS